MHIFNYSKETHSFLLEMRNHFKKHKNGAYSLIISIDDNLLYKKTEFALKHIKVFSNRLRKDKNSNDKEFERIQMVQIQ